MQPFANAFGPDNVAAQISSCTVDTHRATQDTRQPTTGRRASVTTTPPPPCYSQPHITPANFPGIQSDTARQEIIYRGPQPTNPDFTRRDPGEFARLKLALTNLLPDEATELFKCQVDHLKLADARLIAYSFLNSSTPYSDTLAALTEWFGRPHQLALSKIAAIMDASDVQSGDTVGFEPFALQIQALVGFLKILGAEGDVELHCGSHVARLLSKLHPEQRASFRRHMSYESGSVYTLLDLAKWLKFEFWCQDPESFGGYEPQK